MTSHFKFYPASSQVVIPPNALYTFPSQANKSIKTTPRIPPKNGADFKPGNTIRLEFPAQGYVNCNNTTLVFDVVLDNFDDGNSGIVYIQNNIQSLFNRVRLLYGSTPLEDILEYNQWVRNLTDWTSTNVTNFDQFTISEGIGQMYIEGGNSITTTSPDATNHDSPLLKHARITMIQSKSGAGGDKTTQAFTQGRRYQVQLGLGLLTQGKYLPTKWMASQLAIEITLATAQESLMVLVDRNPPTTGATTGVFSKGYTVKNVALVPEILEFDSSYDAVFLKGLQEGGVPLKFNKIHTFTFTHPGGKNANIIIPERSRSVKALFTIIRRQTPAYKNDAGATFGSCDTNNYVDSYQYRIGGRYFPASPVQVSGTMGSIAAAMGGCEAYTELAKCLNTLGDYRLSCATNAYRWNHPYVTSTVSDSVGEADGNTAYVFSSSGAAVEKVNFYPETSQGSAVFCMAISLETSNGAEISGLNAEEQSDISLSINWGGSNNVPASTFNIQTFVLYDAVVILKPNNVLELIE